MTAITAAAVSHTITRNCSQGGIQVMLMLMTAMTMMIVMVMTAMMMVMLPILDIIYVQHCECEPRYGRRRRTAWQWGGCSDNVYFGEQVIMMVRRMMIVVIMISRMILLMMMYNIHDVLPVFLDTREVGS